MNALEIVCARSPLGEATGEPNPLLRFLAGEHAEAIARLWPNPHTEFFALVCARRHLAALALAQGGERDALILRDALLQGRFRDALRFVWPRPQGLSRALGRMGEQLWPADGYRALIALLAEPNANLVVRHARVVSMRLIENLGALPPALRTSRILENVPSLAVAGALSEAFEAARWINSRRSTHDLVDAWRRAEGPEKVLRAALEALKPDRFGAMGPAPALPRPYRRLAARETVEAAALRFRNCVSGYLWELAADELAFYVWEGEPNAVVALKRDVGGWRFAEALGEANGVLPDRILATMATDMRRAGVRVGAPVRAIIDRLEALADAIEAAPAPAPTYAALLGLGQLWR